MDLVPGQQFVRGDVERFADGAIIAQERHKTLGEIFVMGQHPERRTITVDQDFLAIAHAVDRRPATLHRQQGLVVGAMGAQS